MFKIRGECTCNNDLWHWNIVQDKLVLVCTDCGKELGFTIQSAAIDLLAHTLKQGS